MATKAKLGAGNVPIKINGEERVLRPSLHACQQISRATGGVMSAIEAVQRVDIDAMAAIAAIGLGLEGQAAKDLPEQMWQDGPQEFVVPLMKYLGMIANGGRPADGGEEAGDPPSE